MYVILERNLNGVLIYIQMSPNLSTEENISKFVAKIEKAKDNWPPSKDVSTMPVDKLISLLLSLKWWMFDNVFSISINLKLHYVLVISLNAVT